MLSMDVRDQTLLETFLHGATERGKVQSKRLGLKAFFRAVLRVRPAVGHI